MFDFSNDIGITELDDTPSHTSHAGWNGNCYADDQWEKTWGTPLQFIDGAYRFSKKYLCFTFFIERDNYAQFSKARQGSITVFGNYQDGNGRMIRTTVNYGDGDGLSKDDAKGEVMIISLTDDISSDKRIVVRATIETKKLYDFGKITEVQCSVVHGSGDIKIGYLKMNEANIWSEIKSYNGGQLKILGIGTIFYDNIAQSSIYTSRSFCPINAYSGTLEIGSKIRDSEELEKNYFTGQGGVIQVKVGNNLTFLHNEGIKPKKFFFYGKDKDGKDASWYPDNEIVFTNNIYEIDTAVALKNFSVVTKIYTYFGRDVNNKVLVRDYTKGFLNYDLQKNLILNFNEIENLNNNLIDYDNSTDPSVHKAYFTSSFKGTIDFPLNLFSEPQGEVYLRRNETDQRIDFSIDNGTLTIKNNDDNITWIKDGNNMKFDGRTFEDGKYQLKCMVTHKLKVKTEFSDYYTFEVNNLEIKSQKNRFLVFGIMTPEIQYSPDNYIRCSVPGSIILQGERLQIPEADNEDINIANKGFFIYDISDGKQQTITNCYFLSNGKRIAEFGQYSHKFFSYNELAYFLGLTSDQKNNPDYRFDTTLTFDFDLKDKNTTYKNFTIDKKNNFPIAIGIAKRPAYTSYKAEQDGLSYYLQDNGGDKTTTKNQNKFISDKQEDETKFFSFAREGFHENISLIFKEDAFEEGETEKADLLINVQVTKDNIENLLSLLKIHQTNKLNLYDFIEQIMTLEERENLFEKLELGLSEGEEDNDINRTKAIKKAINSTLSGGKINLKIQLNYKYQDDSGSSFNRELFSIILENLSFIPDDIPLGLRKHGAIINAGEKEELASSNNRKNTFVINVKETTATTESGVKTYTPINGCRIVFDTGEEGVEMPYFEIYLDSNGGICFASDKGTFKPTFS